LQPGDDVGNRRSHRELRHPPDDIGNRRPPEDRQPDPPDNIGNRIEIAPTHMESGVLSDVDGKRRRKKRGYDLVRMGRFFVGGVNPIVGGNQALALKAEQELYERRPQAQPQPQPQPQRSPERSPELSEEEDGERGGRRRRRRRDGRDFVDGDAAQEVSSRRARRFFDFEEEDRLSYTLQSDPEDKRKAAEDLVTQVLVLSERDATVQAKLIADEGRPKVLVLIEDRGPAKGLDAARQADNAKSPLFVRGSAALMSLNFLVNKSVNRFPKDRIRLAVLPQSDEALYMESLAAHIAERKERSPKASESAPPPAPGAASAAGPAKTAQDGEKPPPTPPKDGPSAPIKAESPAEPAKKASAKKAATKKVAAKKAVAKKAVAKKAKVKKAATKKAVTKKAATKKTATKKATTKKKAATKKTAAKKAVKKKTKAK
jgi:hypothetical protein